MPQAVIGFVGQLVVGAYWGLVGLGLTEGAALFVINLATGLASVATLGALTKKLTEIPDLAQSAQSNLITTRGTIEHQRLIYGEVLVSGPLWYMNAAGSHNQSLYHAIVVAGHEVAAMTDVWLDDNEILNESIGGGLGYGPVNSFWPRGNASYDSPARFYKKLGEEDQTYEANLAGAFSEITTEHRGRGIAYFVARLDYFEGQTDVWSAGAPQNYKVLVKGKKVYDPRSDSTQSFGTGPHRVNSPSTWEWSDNPALCWADYMIDSQHGFAEVSSRIDYGYVASAAEWCDGTVPLPDNPGPGGTDKRYRCNGILSVANTYKVNLEAILSSANMTMALVQGKWKLRPFAFETPTLQFTDDDLRGDLQIRLTTPENERYNMVRGVFVDKDRQYEPHTFPAFTSTEYIARDNSETIIKDIQLPMTTDIFAAQRIAAGILEQSDLQTTVVYPSNFKTLPVEINGTIGITNEKMGWSEKPFRVTNYKLSDMKGIDLVLQEDSPSAYADVGTAEYSVSSGGLYTTADPGVPAPTSFELTNMNNGVELNWKNPPARLFEYIEIHRGTVNSFSQATQVAETRLNHFEGSPPQDSFYYYWIRARNWAGEVSSPAPHQYSGEIGVYGDDGSLVINHDPQFSQTPHYTHKYGAAAERFWTPIDTVDLALVGVGNTSVRSFTYGSGDSKILRMEMQTEARSYGPTFLICNNKKRVPFLLGAGMSLQVRYRVPVYQNVISNYLLFDLEGMKHLHDNNNYEIYQRKVSYTNSTGWITVSDYLDAASWDNLGSFSYCWARIIMANYQGTTVPNTPRCVVNIDTFHFKWVAQ